ncbi:MAG: HAD-IA family hydrolase [Clostridia bacterium]|nr:HAD-IA family hydrolase [Clostridia bacterium]
MLWVTPRELLYHRFCPADVAIARRISLTEAPIRAVLWDYDGTLMDTYPDMIALMHTICRDLDIPADEEEIAALMRVGMPYCIAVLSARGGLDKHAIRSRIPPHNSENACCRPIAGIPETVRALQTRGIRQYMVTHRDNSCWDGLRHAGLDSFFSGAVTREDGFPRKPAPDMVLAALERFDIRPEEAIMIGDRPLDVRAAMSCGVLGALLDPDDAFPVEPCAFRFSSAHEIADTLCPKPIEQ